LRLIFCSEIDVAEAAWSHACETMIAREEETQRRAIGAAERMDFDGQAAETAAS